MSQVTQISTDSSLVQESDSEIVQPTDIIDDTLYLFIMFINLGVICQAVSIFGIASNIINIIVFTKQGFSDTMNISLLGLAISDLCSLLTMMWSNLCFLPAFRDSDIPWVTYEVNLVTGLWPHVMFAKVTGWITAFISLERCVCVLLPLKVREIFTPKTHLISMVTFFVVTLVCGSSFGFTTTKLSWKFYPEKNKTLLGILYSTDTYENYVLDIISFIINGMFMPVASMLCVTIFTFILVVKLKQAAAWRSLNSSSLIKMDKKMLNKDINFNTKEQKATKMVVLISTVFIICLVPAIPVFIGGCVEPKLTHRGLYKNLVLTLMSVTFTAECINSSINIFAYISVSTKYRRTFKNLFRFHAGK